VRCCFWKCHSRLATESSSKTAEMRPEDLSRVAVAYDTKGTISSVLIIEVTILRQDFDEFWLPRGEEIAFTRPTIESRLSFEKVQDGTSVAPESLLRLLAGPNKRRPWSDMVSVAKCKLAAPRIVHLKTLEARLRQGLPIWITSHGMMLSPIDSSVPASTAGRCFCMSQSPSSRRLAGEQLLQRKIFSTRSTEDRASAPVEVQGVFWALAVRREVHRWCDKSRTPLTREKVRFCPLTIIGTETKYCR